MHSIQRISLMTLLLACATVQAQTPPAGGGGKIVCWKNKAGQTVGCGDKVPPEYQDNATKQLNDRGITIKLSDPAPTPEQKKALQAETDRKAAEKLAAAEQARKDRALLDTFTTVKEIDLKRNRDIQLIESNIEAQTTNLKNANDRQIDARSRMDPYKKENKPVPVSLQEESDRAEAGKLKIQAQITQKRKDIVELNQQYDALKKRYTELTVPAATTAAPGTAPAPAPAPAPAASTAAAKK
ncbi:MAG: hypothetical protein ABIS45_11485 [Burkholderiales bacterium]